MDSQLNMLGMTAKEAFLTPITEAILFYQNEYCYKIQKFLDFFTIFMV
ncbi:hypothetical protein HY745_12755 [Candidatus Desantisbacteria bacterium]|nr:hypothetical protein [Candidatus Desantisbacteria bacterium]